MQKCAPEALESKLNAGSAGRPADGGGVLRKDRRVLGRRVWEAADHSDNLRASSSTDLLICIPTKRATRIAI
jgi:hypothetical protein